MKIVLATGIYPPAIGGPATYCRQLAEQLTAKGEEVMVVSFADKEHEHLAPAESETWEVHRVSKSGGPFLRWWRYAKVLRRFAADADIVYAFSSVSVGIPLWLSHLRRPCRVLRLGGDFRWERATDKGERASLTQWYETDHWFHDAMNGLLQTFQHIVFSTEFQEALYEKSYRALPSHSVIENALPGGTPVHHTAHDPFALLFLGRFVPFKNLLQLLEAMRELTDVSLTLAGDGPQKSELERYIEQHQLSDRVRIVPPVHGEQKHALFLEHDVLILPSLTEISPNSALEARSAGLPVLLTESTGLRSKLCDGMILRPLSTSRAIIHAVREVKEGYASFADRSSAPAARRGWDEVGDEHLTLFRALL